MHFTPRLQQLLSALRCLPGVGPKSAQRMAFHLLDRDRARADELAHALQSALDEVGHCQNCRMFAEQTLCPICDDQKRDALLLCVVETPADVIAVDESGSYRGRYFVLMGRLSPLDGIGPEELDKEPPQGVEDEIGQQDVTIAQLVRQPGMGVVQNHKNKEAPK